ncbi:IS66 family insertion sequence element accessory protein TnpB [Salmonella enterica]|nr:IS66 family insertion sequence element accessory protein TnpB [Salmonella enterica]
MSKPRWSIDQKKHHVTAWRTSGLTRQQYCELYDIPFKSLRQWPQDIAKAERRANEPTVLPVHIAPPLHADAPPPVEPVTLFLPGGIRMCCQPSQLTDVFRALKYAQA